MYYVDDVVLIDKDLEGMKENLSKIANWCDTNCLTLNLKKTKWMEFPCTGGHVGQFGLLGVNASVTATVCK